MSSPAWRRPASFGAAFLAAALAVSACSSAPSSSSTTGGSVATTRSGGQGSTGRAGGTPSTSASSSSGSTTSKGRAPGATGSTKGSSLISKGSGHATSPSPAPAKASSSDPVTYDSSTRSATIYLVEGEDGFTFDRQKNGGTVVTVPVGWSITIQCHNAGNIPHSCAVVDGPNTQTPAFSGAETHEAVYGMQPGQTEHFTFSASKAGRYRIACLVPGHEDSGMWAVLMVSPSVAAPTLST